MTPPGVKVLLADDDDEWRQLAADVLSQSGYTVTAAADGVDAWKKFLEAEPLVVVTDLRMPRMAGQQLLVKLRAKDKRIPVIVMSADRVESASELSRDAFRVLAKPVNVDDMLVAVRDAAEHRRHRLPLNLLWRAARASRRALPTDVAIARRARPRSTRRWADFARLPRRVRSAALGALLVVVSAVLAFKFHAAA